MAERAAQRKARAILNEMERAVRSAGAVSTDAWRAYRLQAIRIIRSGADLPTMQRELDRLTRNLRTALGPVYEGAAVKGGQLGAGAGFETLQAQGIEDAKPFRPVAELSEKQRQILETRRTNDIVGLTLQNQAKVNAQIAAFVDPDVDQGLGATIKNIKRITGQSARQTITQIRTESNNALTKAQVLQQDALMEGVDRTGWEKEWDASGLGRHDDMEGERVPIDEDFTVTATDAKGKTVGVDQMSRPRDPNAPAYQVINCGCAFHLVAPGTPKLEEGG